MNARTSGANCSRGSARTSLETTARRSVTASPTAPVPRGIPRPPVADGTAPRTPSPPARPTRDRGGRPRPRAPPSSSRTRVHHPLGDAAGMERLGEGLAHVAQRHALAAPPLRLREEPRVLERHRGLVREGLGQPQILVGVDAAEEVADREAAHHLPLHHQRQREHRRAQRLPRAACSAVGRDAGVHADVGGHHRVPAVHGQADHAVAPRESPRRDRRSAPPPPRGRSPRYHPTRAEGGRARRRARAGPAAPRRRCAGRARPRRRSPTGSARPPRGPPRSAAGVSLSAKSRALPIATAAWLASRSTISRSSAVGGAVSESATLSTPISSPPALIGTP